MQNSSELHTRMWWFQESTSGLMSFPTRRPGPYHKGPYIHTTMIPPHIRPSSCHIGTPSQPPLWACGTTPMARSPFGRVDQEKRFIPVLEAGTLAGNSGPKSRARIWVNKSLGLWIPHPVKRNDQKRATLELSKEWAPGRGLLPRPKSKCYLAK